MPANIIIPANAGQYPSNLLVAAPYDWQEPPDGGTQRISGSINWGGGEVMSGATIINFQGTISGFDKIRGMYVDNTQSAADVTFFFPDTSFEFTVNGGEKDFFQVVTNARQVVAIATLAIASDKTFFQLFNFSPPPLASNKSVLTSVQIASSVALTGNSTTPVIAAGTNGTVRGLSVIAFDVTSGAGLGKAVISLVDGSVAPVTLWSGAVEINAATTQLLFANLINMTGLNVRFVNGLNLVIATSGVAFTTGGTTANVYFGTP